MQMMARPCPACEAHHGRYDDESLISLSEALDLLPPARRNKRPHLSRLLRWILDGVNGVRLEAIRLGGRWVTSREALQRFCERLTPNLTTRDARVPAFAGLGSEPRTVRRVIWSG